MLTAVTKARVVGARNVTPSVIEIALAEKDGKEFPNFQPGQYATLCFTAYTALKGPRSFSFCSAPTERNIMRFGIKTSGKYTNTLCRLRPGDVAMVGGPYGKFVFDPKNESRSAVFLAGGIGITPLLSMIQNATDLKLKNKLNLFYSARSIKEIAYRTEIDRLEKINPNLRVIYAVTDNNGSDLSENIYFGRINREMIARTLAGNIWEKEYYLCGPTPFMAAIETMLLSMGVSKTAIKTERFGVGSRSFIEKRTLIPKIIFSAWGISAAALIFMVAKTELNRQSNAGVTSQNIISEAPVKESFPASADNSAALLNSNVPVISETAVPPTNQKSTSVSQSGTAKQNNSNPVAVTPAQPSNPAPAANPPAQPKTVQPAPVQPAPQPAPIQPRTTVS